MLDIRNEAAPKPIGTSGNNEEATEPEDDEYQSDESDEMDEVRDLGWWEGRREGTKTVMHIHSLLLARRVMLTSAAAIGVCELVYRLSESLGPCGRREERRQSHVRPA